MPSSFQNKKRLRFIITTSGGARNRITIEGLRATADIDKAGGMMMGQLSAKIYGVAQGDMNAVTTLQWRPAKTGDMSYLPNTIEVFAIDGDAESLVFSGNIVNAWADYQNPPAVFLNVKAMSAMLGQLSACPPRSFKGEVDVAIVMLQIAEDLGLTFENNGVTARMSDIYLSGDLVNQARELANSAGIVLAIDNGVLAICPRNNPRAGDVPLVSAATGLIGYPAFDGAGIICRMLFNPALRFMGQFQLETEQTRASGLWTATSIAYQLESEKPNGAWFQVVRGNFDGAPYVGK